MANTYIIVVYDGAAGCLYNEQYDSLTDTYIARWPA
jgi:hypothetical protein